MSNLRSMSGQGASRVPTPPRGEPIARYDTYLEAQRAVDYLSDHQFPVQFVTIVGTGLRMVERVTGRLTYPRVAGASAASGLYFGFFVGVALSLFGGGNQLSIFAIALVGAGFGMLFGIISYALTGGRRDFTSTSQIVASEYEVLCMPEQAQQARELLVRLPGGRGREHPSAPAGSPAGYGPGGGAYPGQPGGPYAGGGYAPGPYGSGGPGSYPGAGQPGGPYGAGGPGPGYPPPVASPSPGGPPPVGAPSPGGPPPGYAEPAPTELIGPTSGEMIERQRQEQRAREAAEREASARAAAEREAAERSAEQAAAERAAAERAARDRALREPGSGGPPDESRP
jgi:hypothetical protein